MSFCLFCVYDIMLLRYNYRFDSVIFLFLPFLLYIDVIVFYFSEVAWQLSLSPLESHKEKVEEGYLPKSKDLYAESLSIFLFKSLLNSDNSVSSLNSFWISFLFNSFFFILMKFGVDSFSQEIEFIKQGSFNSKDLDAIVSTLRLSGARENIKKSSGKNSGGIRGRNGLPAMAEKSLSSLEAMGVRVYGVENSQGVPVKGADGMTSWDIIAGYEHQKRYAHVACCVEQNIFFLMFMFYF